METSTILGGGSVVMEGLASAELGSCTLATIGDAGRVETLFDSIMRPTQQMAESAGSQGWLVGAMGTPSSTPWPRWTTGQSPWLPLLLAPRPSSPPSLGPLHRFLMGSLR